MPLTNFIAYQTPITADFLNKVDAATINAIGDGVSPPSTKAQVISNLGAATYAKDASGNVTGLVGPSGYIIKTKGSLFQGTSTIIFGDSFTQHNNSSGLSRDLDWGYFTWANAFLGHPFNVLKNSGISGNTTTQMLDRINNDVIAYSPQCVFLQGGINDFNAGATAESSVANLKSIITQLTSLGINVFFLSIAPNATYTTKVNKANKLMREWISRTASGVVYIDVYSALVNPTDTTGALAAGMSDDALHPSIKGARTYGNAIFNALKNIIISSNKLVASASDTVAIDATSSQILTNPLMAGTGGTVSGTGASGTVANGWTAGTSAGTVTNVWAAGQVRADGIGVDQQVTVTAASSGAVVNIRQSNIQAQFSIGDTVYFSGSIIATGMADVQYITPTIQFTIDGVTVLNTTLELNGTSTTYDQTDLTINFQTPDIALTGANITSALAFIKVGFGTSGAGAGVFKFGRLGLFKR